MKEEDKNMKEVTGSNDSNWVSKELGKEDDEEGELLEGALNILIGPEPKHCLAVVLLHDSLATALGRSDHSILLGEAPEEWSLLGVISEKVAILFPIKISLLDICILFLDCPYPASSSFEIRQRASPPVHSQPAWTRRQTWPSRSRTCHRPL